MADLRPELQSVLTQLRSRIRRYVFIEGAALILAVLGGLFWLSLAVDHAWFQISRLELPQWFRASFDIGVVGLVAFLLLSWVGLRLLRSYRTKALALVLERRFPELDDRLVTAVELAEAGSVDQGKLAVAMAGRTIDDAVKATRQLDLASVFDRGPLQRALVAAAVAIASIGGLAVASNSTLQTWKNSFIDLDAEYWRRETGLVIRVIAQPGDIVREFNDQFYKHARGADLTIQIDVEEGRKAPERVQLKYRLANGRGQGTVLCSRVGDSTFRHSLAALLDDVEFYVYGGDFVNRTPYRVHIVEPPQLDQVELACFYPAYTRMRNPESTDEKPLRDVVPVRGTQVELPNETEFLLNATCNKPLTKVRMQFGGYELTFGRSTVGADASARLVHRSEEDEVLENRDIPAEVFGKWVSEDGTRISVPFVLSAYETDAAITRADGLTTEVGKPFVLAPDTNLRIYLEDSDGILTAEPSRIQVGGIVDETPIVETGLRGIGTSITRKASIPVLGRLIDDYGLASAQFEFKVDETEVADVRPFKNALSTHQDGSSRREFELDRDEEFERFEVLPLDLSLGQRLVLSVVATDGDNLNGPHRSRGERYAFKVVSNEELQSVLYQRELNLRAQFERVITETKQTQQDLILHRSRIDAKKRLLADKDESETAETAKRIREIELAVTACAERSLHAVRKNANETASVELSFRDIREELVNNGLHTPQTLERIDDRIVKPLGLITANDFPAVDEALGVFRLTNERRNNATEAIDHSVEMLRGMIIRMERVLAEMEKLKEFQKAVEELKLILEQQRGLLERTKKERKRKLLLESLQ
ncbi:MAG: hypothetical protein ACKVHE_02530 [Planctomycetales bacterium]|jgi:hypothetical protein